MRLKQGKPLLVEDGGFWHRWIGNRPGGDVDTAVMFIRHLAHRWGRRIDLHRFVRADDPGCYHTHPATAIRIVLWGGYVEEVWPSLHQELWLPGDVGIVTPGHCHRICRLADGPSYSLWLRGPITHDVELRGSGYANVNPWKG